ncbi:MAG: CocE/NonD family hydrolase [bacterium]
MNRKILLTIVMIISFLAVDMVKAQADGKIKISQMLIEYITKEGVESAIQKYQQIKSDTVAYLISAGELLNVGNRLLAESKLKEALSIFDLTTNEYPESYWAFYQSGRAYMTAGKFDAAIEKFKKSNKLKEWFVSQRFIYTLENYTKTVVDIPMRDGIKLKTIIYSPKSLMEKYPFLVVRSPYGIGPYEPNVFRSILGALWSIETEGYIFVYQDVRGKRMSEGEFVEVRPFIPVKTSNKDIDESTDAYDTFEWLLKNVPNNNGKIGMWGGSYHAYYSLMALLSKHSALVAVASEAPITDWFEGDDFHRNGAFYLLQAVNFFRTNGVQRSELISDSPESILDYPSPDLYSFFLNVGPLTNWNEKHFNDRLPFWNEMMSHGNYDEFWKQRNIRPYLKDINAHVLNVGGWYDAENLFGTLNTYKEIEKNNTNNNSIIMGSWFHTDWSSYGEERYSEILVNKKTTGQFFEDSVLIPFFNYHLKGKGKLNSPEALMFDGGSLKWNKFQTWPPKNTKEKKFYFSKDNVLSEEKSNEQNILFDEFVSDPLKPVPHSYKIEDGWDSNFMITDQRFASRRPDVLYYQTSTLEEDLTLTGEIEVELYVSTTGTDADWFVKVIDVYPENEPDYEGISDKTHMGEYQSLVRLGVMRGKFRNSLEKPEPFTPGKVTKVKFKLNDICHTFKKGHKFMVQIQSSCFPLFDINPQKFCDIYDAEEKDFQKATHRVFLNGVNQSKIIVDFLQ